MNHTQTKIGFDIYSLREIMLGYGCSEKDYLSALAVSIVKPNNKVKYIGASAMPPCVHTENNFLDNMYEAIVNSNDDIGHILKKYIIYRTIDYGIHSAIPATYVQKMQKVLQVLWLSKHVELYKITRYALSIINDIIMFCTDDEGNDLCNAIIFENFTNYSQYTAVTNILGDTKVLYFDSFDAAICCTLFVPLLNRTNTLSLKKVVNRLSRTPVNVQYQSNPKRK